MRRIDQLLKMDEETSFAQVIKILISGVLIISSFAKEVFCGRFVKEVPTLNRGFL